MVGAEVRWRIVLHIGSSQPELRAALAEVPARARAERLRQLALLGLYNLRRGSVAATIPPPAQVGETHMVLEERRDRLLRSLAAGEE
jgi:hypothetical protein